MATIRGATVCASPSGEYWLGSFISKSSWFSSSQMEIIDIRPGDRNAAETCVSMLGDLGFFKEAVSLQRKFEYIPEPRLVIVNFGSNPDLREGVRSAALDYMLGDGTYGEYHSGTHSLRLIGEKLLRDAWKARSFSRVWNSLDTLGKVEDDIESVLLPVAEKAQAALDGLVGKPVESFEVTQRIVAVINTVLARLGRAIACPKEGCGHPAKVRCYQPRSGEAAVIQFDHTIDGKRTNHGAYSTFPKMQLVTAPPDRRRKEASD